MLYMRARSYDRQTQQSLTRDPLRPANQPYAYANRNPVNYIDPTGTQAEEEAGGFGGGEGGGAGGQASRTLCLRLRGKELFDEQP